ncbi:MAG: hypothetical protein V2A76_10695 [Planctomycetota bacterium]
MIHPIIPRTILFGLSVVGLGTFLASDLPAQDAPADTTSVSADGEDPLGWVGEREILFIARVKGTGAVLRSGPDPAYRVLRGGQEGELLLVVGDARGHVEVLVPAGFTAYIHGRYVDLGDDDIGTVNTDRVNVRSRPTSTGDYPLGKVHTGEKLMVYGPAETDPEWYRIVAPADMPLFAADDEVEIAGDPVNNPELLDGIAAARRTRTAAFERRSPEAIARLEAKERAQQAPGLVRQAAGLLEEAGKLGLAADYSDSRALLAQALADSDDPVLRAQAGALDEQIVALERLQEEERERLALLKELQEEKDRLAAERERIRQLAEAAGTKENEPAPIEPGKPGSWSGFLRTRPNDLSHPISLEQGTQVRAWLLCSSGKLRLKDYAGLQVQVSGRTLRAEGAPVVDVDRLEILLR